MKKYIVVLLMLYCINLKSQPYMFGYSFFRKTYINSLFNPIITKRIEYFLDFKTMKINRELMKENKVKSCYEVVYTYEGRADKKRRDSSFYSFNKEGQLIKYTNTCLRPDESCRTKEEYFYNDTNVVKSVINDSITVHYNYNNEGLLTNHIVNVSGKTTRLCSYEYDSLKHLQKVIDDTVVWEYKNKNDTIMLFKNNKKVNEVYKYNLQEFKYASISSDGERTCYTYYTSYDRIYRLKRGRVLYVYEYQGPYDGYDEGLLIRNFRFGDFSPHNIDREITYGKGYLAFFIDIRYNAIVKTVPNNHILYYYTYTYYK